MIKEIKDLKLNHSQHISHFSAKCTVYDTVQDPEQKQNNGDLSIFIDTTLDESGSKWLDVNKDIEYDPYLVEIMKHTDIHFCVTENHFEDGGGFVSDYIFYNYHYHSICNIVYFV